MDKSTDKVGGCNDYNCKNNVGVNTGIIAVKKIVYTSNHKSNDSDNNNDIYNIKSKFKIILIIGKNIFSNYKIYKFFLNHRSMITQYMLNNNHI